MLLRIGTSLLRMLIQIDVEVNGSVGIVGRLFTAQHRQFGHIDIVKVLIQNGADVNAVTNGKDTALHFAAEKGHVDVAKVLLQKKRM